MLKSKGDRHPEAVPYLTIQKENTFMTIGNNIKTFRTKKEMTQKDLADELHVTAQAVSRWENDDVEPSLDTLMKLTEVLGCTLDELFGKGPTEAPAEETAPVEEAEAAPVVVTERVIVEQAPPVLALCEKCNKPITRPEDIRRKTYSHHSGGGRHRHTTHTSAIYCPDCYDRIQKEEREEQERRAAANLAQKKEKYRKRRIRAYVLPALICIIPLIFAITYFDMEETTAAIISLVAMIPTYTFFACLFLHNNFVADLWIGIAVRGCVRFPALIFTFDLDGIAWLIGMKILFAVIGFLLGLLAEIAATVICAAISLFVYPFALAGNYKLKDSEYDI